MKQCIRDLFFALDIVEYLWNVNICVLVEYLWNVNICVLVEYL